MHLNRTYIYRFLLLAICLLLSGILLAQPNILRSMGNRLPKMSGSQGSGGDSLRHRTNLEDSITIWYRLIDSSRNYTFDSTLSDFTKRYPIPATHVFLGNTGTATHSLLFAPSATIGWDPGFHTLDVYKFKTETARFFNTTRPYTELGYLLGSKAEQIIDILHTQNIKPYWNASFRYRLINSPGIYKNQKTVHNNYQLTSWYESPKKRYNNYFVLVNNNLKASENGGVPDSINYLAYNDLFIVPTKLGGTNALGRQGMFNSNITTGQQHRELTIMMRQQYDFGKKDSLVTDSTVIPLFYPRLRLEHTFKYGKYRYNYIDDATGEESYNNYYHNYYDFDPSDSLSLMDEWREINNDFSIYQFPDAKNLKQFIKVGIQHQFLQTHIRYLHKGFYNLIAHGEYRNRTRNQKWDMEANGTLYLNGYNAGDYEGYISLQRFISAKLGTLKVGFQNTNSSPSFIYNQLSDFYLDDPSKSFSKENITHLFGTIDQPRLKLQLTADYYLVANYLYLSDYFKLQQENALFNVLRIGALKTFALSRHWNWYAEAYLQQKTGNADINLPLFYTRNRLAFEGTFFKNLNLSTGLEVRYHTPYYADGYSPVLGQFFYQDSMRISNRPDVTAFMHFRIRSFKAYIRAENLNSLSFLGNTSPYRRNNFAAPGYPYPGFMMRFGVYWSFVN